jgi:hypothetical protein
MMMSATVPIIPLDGRDDLDCNIHASKGQNRVSFEMDNSISIENMGESRSVLPFQEVPKAGEGKEEASVCSSDCDPEYDIDILLTDMVMSILEDMQEVIDRNMGTLR